MHSSCNDEQWWWEKEFSISAAPNPFLLYTLWLVSACANTQNWNRIRKKIFKWKSCCIGEFNSMRGALRETFLCYEKWIWRADPIIAYSIMTMATAHNSFFPFSFAYSGQKFYTTSLRHACKRVICCHIFAHISVYEQSTTPGDAWRRLDPIRLLLLTTESVLVKFMRRMKYEEYDFLASSHHCLSRRRYTWHFSSSGEWVTVSSLSQFASSIVFFLPLWSLFCIPFFFVAHHFSMRDRICWFLSQVLTWKCWKCWW